MARFPLVSEATWLVDNGIVRNKMFIQCSQSCVQDALCDSILLVFETFYQFTDFPYFVFTTVR